MNTKNKQWWKDKSPHELSLRGAYAAKKRWENTSKEKRIETAIRLNQIRWGKNKLST